MSHNILVTGGAGYIGSILVPDLLAEGHKVTVLDNFMFEQSSLNHVCSLPNFQIIKGDIRVESTMRAALKHADVIIPLAALVGAPLCAQDPVGAATINVDAVVMMLKLVSPQQMILMPTTNNAYGSGGKDNYCNEETPLTPVSEYSVQKAEVEQYLMQHPGAISFRLATLFGMSPRMRIDLLVNDFTYRAVKDRFVVLFESNFKRTYVHVRDVSRAFRHGLANYDAMKGNIYNIGLSDENLSKLELCQLIQTHYPDFVFFQSDIGRDPDQRNYIVSHAKMEATGYRTQHSLDMGVAELIKGYTMLRNARYGNV